MFKIQKFYLYTNQTILLIILVVSLLKGEAYAQDKLTLRKAWSTAVVNNYTIQQQEKLIERAREEISIQKTDYYPSLSSSALIARANFDKLPFNIPDASGKLGIDLFSLSLNQQVFSGFRTKNLIVSANEQLLANEIHKQSLHNSVLLEVGNLFYEIQSALLKQNVLKSSADRINNQLIRIRNLYLSEQATPFDTLEISNRKLQVENQRAILDDNYQILLSQLRYLLNQDNLPPVAELSPGTARFSLNPKENYLELAIQHRPELKNIAALKRAQMSYSDVLRARYYPQLSASFSFNYLKPTGDLLKSEWTNFYSILVNLQWELWNWKRDAKKIQQAELETDRLGLREKQLLLDIKHQIKVAFQNLLSSRRRIQLQSKLVVQEKERFRITEERYQQGLATFLDLNSAELSLTEAETELQNYYINWYKNKIQLDFATGIIGYSDTIKNSMKNRIKE